MPSAFGNVESSKLAATIFFATMRPARSALSARQHQQAAHDERRPGGDAPRQRLP